MSCCAETVPDAMVDGGRDGGAGPGNVVEQAPLPGHVPGQAMALQPGSEGHVAVSHSQANGKPPKSGAGIYEARTQSQTVAQQPDSTYS